MKKQKQSKPTMPEPRGVLDFEVWEWSVFLPDNEYGIAEGYYGQKELVSLLRVLKNNPDAIQFIADMLE